MKSNEITVLDVWNFLEHNHVCFDTQTPEAALENYKWFQSRTDHDLPELTSYQETLFLEIAKGFFRSLEEENEDG